MPSSSVEVATMTQSFSSEMPPRPAGVRTTLREAWLTKVRISWAAACCSVAPRCFGSRRRPAASRRGAGARSRWLRFRASRHGRWSRRRPCSRCTAHHASVPTGCKPGQQLARVAHRCRQADALQRSLQILVQPMQHRAQVPAAVVAANACSSSTITPQVAEPCWPIDPHRDQHGLDGLGVVSRMSGASLSARFLRDCEMSPCQTSTRRPTRPA
jgi:hypothetical protein